MKTRNLFIVLVTMALIPATCLGSHPGKDGYIRKYQEWIRTMQEEYKTYTKADWLKAEKKFIRFSETEYLKYEDELTSDDKEKLDELEGSYYGMRLMHHARKAKQEAGRALNVAKGIMKEIGREVKK